MNGVDRTRPQSPEVYAPSEREAQATGRADAQPRARGCAPTRPELGRWSARGGPLPVGLAAHVASCRACAARVREIDAAHASLTLLRTQTLPAGLAARANHRALRMLRRVARQSKLARELLAAQPGLSLWQRTRLHVARGSLAAAAALFVLLARGGMLTGLDRTRSFGELLAERHWQRHIDPANEFLHRRDWT